jgi:molecular chaperone Hsp33
MTPPGGAAEPARPVDVAGYDDYALPFLLPALDLRGRLVKFGPAVDAILTRHDYPPPVATLLGETLALAGVLASSIKYDGIFTLQAAGDGPVRVLVADLTTGGHLRGFAAIDRARFDALKPDMPAAPVPRLLGAGHLAFTVDQGEGTERYQGIVDLAGPTLAACAQHYFRQSEQIDTVLRLAVRRGEGRGEGRGGRRWRAGALMVQRLPKAGRDGETRWDMAGLDEDAREDGWRRVAALIGTLDDSELLDPALGGHALLYRLFHEDGVRASPPRDFVDRCRCTRERAAGTLRMLDRGELADYKVDGAVVVTCQFCNRHERFTDADLDALFAEPA